MATQNSIDIGVVPGGGFTYTFPSATSTLYGTGTGTITSSQLAASLTDETGSGELVFATSPSLVTPALGTPVSGVMTNVTGTASGLTSGITNALASATTTINVSSATAPTSGQVLTATSGTAATWQTAGGLTNIAETVIGSAASSISVTGIPTGYRYLMIQVDLQIIGSVTATQRLQMQFNGIAGTAYGHQQTSSASTSVNAERGTDDAAIYITDAANWLENTQHGLFEGTYMVNQTSKQVTTGIWLTSCTGSGGLFRWTGTDTSSKDVITVNGGLKATSTYNITRVDIINDSGNALIDAGSRVTIYGYN